MFWNKKEIVYTDVLDEWRKVKILDFNLFDKVICKWIEWIFVIIWIETNSIYTSNSNYKWISFYRNWRIEYTWESYEECVYDCYNLIKTDWSIFKWDEVQKYYWEFQEEFESLDKAVRDEEILKQKIEEIKVLEKSISENYNKARSIQWKNYLELWIK